MSTKRKRLPDSEDSTPAIGTPQTKKRKGRITNAERAKIRAEMKKAKAVLEVLKNPRSHKERDITEHFLRVPSRRHHPDYYIQVKNPVDLTQIQQKITGEEYRTFAEFCDDIELLVQNNKSYYKEDSEEHKDAVTLFSVFTDAKEKVENGVSLSDDDDDDDASTIASSAAAHSISSGRVSRASNSSEESIEPLVVDDILCGILELTDSSGRLLSPPFRVLQPKEQFPLYYEKIKQPIDLKRIAEKGRAGEYKYTSEIEADIRLLCRNAQLFSGKNSDIYKDASAIVEYFKEKRDQVLEKGVHSKRKEKIIRVVDSLLSQSSSTLDNEHSEDSEEDEDSEESDDPKWKLYWTLRNEPDDKAEKGACLSDPFLELPSRSCYPDYFDEIKQPMSFFMINKKMKRNGYNTLLELVNDCMLVFANACEYNLEGSAYFISAKKLEALTIKKATELQPNISLPGSSNNKTEKPPVTPKSTSKSKAKALKIKVEIPDSSSDEKEMHTPPPKKKSSPRKQRPISTGMTAEHLSLPGRPGRKSMDELMLRFRQRLMTFWDILYDYKEGEYWPCGAFVELPKPKEYPDYYDIISNPIDMKQIRQKIENNKYDSSVQLLADFQLMFNNARTYNDPSSALAADATRLESMAISAHENTKDAPIESPLCLKQKFGWLKTKLAETKRSRSSANGGEPKTPSAVNLSNGCGGISDDDNSNSSLPRTPSSIATPKSHSKGKNEKKLQEMISRLPPDQQRMWRLFNYLRDYRDEDNRKLSTAFLRLPTREEYPDYYEVIKKPMDMQRIQQRLNSQGYACWTDIVADLSLMLDNACKYNETDSKIYKDAVSLQRVLLEKKLELGASDDAMPRVQVEIRTLFTSIFHAVFSKKDAGGRCRSDSFAELPDLLKAKGIPQDEYPFTFDQIKRNIDKSRYRRLDRFQRDFFDLFEKARSYSKVDSQLFEDATELQVAFIHERDVQCKAVMMSDAFHIIENKVMQDIDILRKHKMKNGEFFEGRRESTDEIAKQEGEVDLPSLIIGNMVYTVPSFVYVARTDENSKGLPHIMRIERIFRNDSGDNMVRGLWVYRPSETLHLPSRRFLENEVFITPFQDNVLAERLLGTCQVVSLKIYLNNEIGGIEPKDLYVCESKYLGKPRYFSKLKNWDYSEEEEALKLVAREKPIEPVRVPSAFVKSEPEMEDGQSSQTSSSSEEDDRLRDSVILDIERHEVRSSQEADADGRTYYCQMLTQAGRHYACGDFVLVFNPQRPYCDVMRIDKLWREADGSEWFSGGWFARPSDVMHDPGRMFYIREVFAVNQSDQTRRVDDIQNHCAVLGTKDYVKMRPTEVPECDVFVCENRIHGQPLQLGETSSIFATKTLGTQPEAEDDAGEGDPMQIDTCLPLRKLKTYKNGNLVVDPEWFLFKTPIAMEKEMSPLLKNDVAVPLDPLDIDMMDENDTDGTESVASTKPEMNNWLANQPKLTAKSKSGYILFSAEIRKRIMHENPEAGFGEVSKIVGIEWKKLSEEQKRQYEVRAEFIATERAKQDAQRNALKEQLQPGQIRVYQCKWANCDFQFDQENGLYEHIVQHHTSQIIIDSDNQYVCMWVTCLRNRKDGKPFPSLPRLHRHMKEKHISSSVRNMYQNQIGKNFYKLVTSSNSSGENIHLVHLPYARGMFGNQQQQPSTPMQQQPHINGHPTPIAINGEHATPSSHHVSIHHQQHSQAVYAHQQPSSSHHPPQHHPQSHQVPSSSQSVPQPESGRVVVKMPPGAEPVFVHMPSSFMSRRVLHSESYLRYIESLSNNRQRSVSNWDKCLNANFRNMPQQQQQQQHGPKKNLPVHWIKHDTAGRNVVPEDEVVKALWRLRDQMLETSLDMSTERDYNGLL